MSVSQKCQYALRAVFELAKREGSGPAKIADIAEAQAIPARFLENILGQLKQGGFVESRRGAEGGYLLSRQSRDLTIGEIMRHVDGPFQPVACMGERGRRACKLFGSCVFLPMWEKAGAALSGVYDNTTFSDLLREEQDRIRSTALCYSI